MIAWSVTQRRQEIAIRMALGASQREMLGMVLMRALILAGTGIGVGLVAAPLATRALQGLLYGITSTDPIAFSGTAVALGVVAMLSALIPAMRVTRIEPASAVKY
jgi:ABC-type antimicrobial peptide transport system permease subunit